MCEAWRNLLEHRQPLACDTGFILQHSGCIACWLGESCNQTRPYGIGYRNKHHRDGGVLTVDRHSNGRGMCENYIWLEGEKLLGEQYVLICAAGREACIDVNAAL